MKRISTKAHVIITGMIYFISLLLFAFSPFLRPFHYIFDPAENSLLQMAGICGVCLFISLAHTPSLVFSLVSALAPYGIIGTIIVMSSDWGLLLNFILLTSITLIYFITIKSCYNSNLSEKTISEVYDDICDFISWIIFPVYVIFSCNLLVFIAFFIR